jgi:hypothetical protein
LLEQLCLTNSVKRRIDLAFAEDVCIIESGLNHTFLLRNGHRSGIYKSVVSQDSFSVDSFFSFGISVVNFINEDGTEDITAFKDRNIRNFGVD